MTAAHTTHDSRHCASDTRCRNYNHPEQRPAWVSNRDPLCDACLTTAARDVSSLVYDYLDLAQLQAPSLSQALNMQPGSKTAPPMPMRAEPEALQREIWHATTLWAGELRRHHRLAAAGRTIIICAWHTTVSNPPPAVRTLHGRDVQEAVAVLEPRVRELAQLPPTAVYPTGCEDDARDIAGWEAAHHLQQLHQRARGMLGRTHRTTRVPGTCPDCAGDLHQDEPRYREDPCPVYCPTCGHQWSRDEYEAWTINILSPARRAEVTA
jgi:hypothetical protein